MKSLNSGYKLQTTGNRHSSLNIVLGPVCNYLLNLARFTVIPVFIGRTLILKRGNYLSKVSQLNGRKDI